MTTENPAPKERKIHVILIIKNENLPSLTKISFVVVETMNAALRDPDDDILFIFFILIV